MQLGWKKFFFVSSSIFVEMGGWQSKNKFYVMRGCGKCWKVLTENMKIVVKLINKFDYRTQNLTNLEIIELTTLLTFSRNFAALFQKFHAPARYFHDVKKKLTFCCVGVYFFTIYATFLGKWVFKFMQAIELLSYCRCDYVYRSDISTKQKKDVSIHSRCQHIIDDIFQRYDVYNNLQIAIIPSRKFRSYLNSNQQNKIVCSRFIFSWLPWR